MKTSTEAPQPRIARIWRGRTTRERADEYAAYLYETGIRPLEEKALGVQLLREDREAESEFVTISYWESVPAMSRFAVRLLTCQCITMSSNVHRSPCAYRIPSQPLACIYSATLA